MRVLKVAAACVIPFAISPAFGFVVLGLGVVSLFLPD
jgi:hypothetical protein